MITMKRFLILLSFGVMALAGMTLNVIPASGHALYESSEPADGAVLPASPPRVDIWFTADLWHGGNIPPMLVVSDNGGRVDVGAVYDDADGHHLFAKLAPSLPTGRYTVIWHTVSLEDGHEAWGAFHFYVGSGPVNSGAVATPAGPAAATAAPTPAGGGTPAPTRAVAPVTPETPTPTVPAVMATPVPPTPEAPPQTPSAGGGLEATATPAVAGTNLGRQGVSGWDVILSALGGLLVGFGGGMVVVRKVGNARGSG